MKTILVTSLTLLVLLSAIDLTAQNAIVQEFVSKGTHKKELALGDYVVIKTFATEADAQKEYNEIKKSGVTEIVYGYLTKKEKWYVCFKSSADIEEAKKLLDNYNKTGRFKDARLLTIHQ